MVRVVMLVVLGMVSACSSPGTDEPGAGTSAHAVEDASGPEAPCEDTADADFPDVVGVGLEGLGDRRFRVSATLCSAYDSPERYADAWRVRTPDGDVLAVRELAHDHASEQPFTRSLADPITVPDGVDTLVVEGRDLANGWGGTTFEARIP